MVLELILFIAILGVLVLSHEFGHFWAAKRSGMRVDEFGFGFPPQIFKMKRGETTYSINLIPFGGFVKIFGEDPGEEEAGSSSRRFTARPRKFQAFVVVAGVLANFILAWILLSASFMVGAPQPLGEGVSAKDSKVFVVEVFPDSPADKAGFLPGDIVSSVSYNNTTQQVENAEDVLSAVEAAGNKELTFFIARDGKEGTITVSSEAGILEGRKAVGISLETIGLVSFSPPRALYEGFFKTIQFIELTARGLFSLIVGAFFGTATLEEVTGPVGIYGLVGDAQSLGFQYLIGFIALLSISLGVINLIPFPALDGGRLLFIIIESIKGSPIRPSIANALNYAGFAILVIFMIVVSIGDLSKLGLF